MDVLRITGLEKGFSSLEVLKGISLSVGRGEVVAILGPSGSGKSTLLRCATLLERAEKGEIEYLGERVDWTDPLSLKKTRGRFGLVFQSFNLFPHYSVLKNITDAPIFVQKKDRADAEAEARALLAKMGLSDKENAYPCELSGGQQQRVSIARALALKPEILFFDEPTSALDPELTGEILRVIRGLAEESMTMVIVTHEIEFARQVADRVIFMADGIIVEQGAAREVIDNPKNERMQAFLHKLDRDA